MSCETVPVQINYGELKDFPAYSGLSESKQTIFDSKLKGSLKELKNFTKMENIDINIDVLPCGIYKIIFQINGEQKIQHLTDVCKGILINNEIKDIYFYKIDVIPSGNKTDIVAIFEIISNPIPILFIIYTIGAAGVAIAGTLFLKSVSKVTETIVPNILNIGVSILAILLGIKVISKW